MRTRWWTMHGTGFVLLLALVGSGGCGKGQGGGGAAPPPVQVIPPVAGAPYVLYTDILSGPTTGGENGKGAYLSIFGMNFGATGLGSSVRVFVNDVEVDNYRYLGLPRGRPDIQQITVQVGALGNPAQGVALPIKVVVDGVASNVDHTFIPNPGRMLFVDNVSGDDATAVPGDVHHPYRHVGLTGSTTSAFGAAQPGDIIVMRGTGAPWVDLAYNDSYFLRFKGKNGSAPAGSAGTGPFTLMAYPNEDVFIDLPPSTGAAGGIAGVDTTAYAGGQWISIADLRIEAGGDAGPIAVQIAGDHWRIVNTELTATTGLPTAKAAGINGNGTNSYWVGNHIHAIYGSPVNLEEHGIYIDGDGSYEIAFNVIDDVKGGSGFQIYVNGGNGSDSCNSVSLHHNVIHGIAKHGINVADGSQNAIQVYDNLVFDVVQAGLRFNTNTLHGAKIWNNTFANTNTNGSSYQGAITNDWNLPADALDMENNIFSPTTSATPYSGGSVGLSAGVGRVTHNLYYGGAGAASFDSAPVSGDPRFATPGSDFHLAPDSHAIDAGSTAVSSLVSTDYDVLTVRPQGRGFDIGAYEHKP
ncbi:MAG TPA: choice-of-anchor Q domain-containing protein [Anaeromyxobacteraceae bacterium]|nr:choice-of-anchor Q domain-containing protein [Anaeromyxobacteraceae bacterium]